MVSRFSIAAVLSCLLAWPAVIAWPEPGYAQAKAKSGKANAGKRKRVSVTLMPGASMQKTFAGKPGLRAGGPLVAMDDPHRPPATLVNTRVKYAEMVERWATTYEVPLSLAHAVIAVESAYQPTARGDAGEVGLMQVMPATAKLMGYDGTLEGLADPETNVKIGMKYLGQAVKQANGLTCLSILYYNAGHAAKQQNSISSAYCRKAKRHMGG